MSTATETTSASNATEASRQPIGYWLRLLDQRIEASFEPTLAACRLTRRHWQALNVMRPGPMTRPRFHQALAPFLGDAPDVLPQVIADLQERGWIAETDGFLSLTTAGQDAVVTMSEAVTSIRVRMTEGISAQQYAATIDTLARMSANLRAGVRD
jgi:DNA-binding MarR family transcriptional regulator